MPLKPEDIALQFVEHINERDLDGLTELMTEEHTFIDIAGCVHQGREMMRDGWAEYFTACPEYTIYVSQIIVVGDTVVLFGSTTGSHLHLPPEAEFRDTAIWTAKIENDRVAEWRIYDDTEKVRDALGVKSGTEVIDVKTLASDIDIHLRLLPSDARTADVRAVRRTYSKRLKNAPAEKIVELAKKLLFEYGHRFVAYELIYYHKKALQSLDAREIEHLGSGINSWSSADIFAHFVAGPAWREAQVPDELIHTWARSPDRWWRRAALVSTVYLNGDVSRTLRVCCMLIDDYDDMIVKALSWALRELIQYDREAVIQVLAEHEDVLAARVKREVKTKLTTGLKNPRR
jgi:3-methyladenine DNA glycosylase AlkD/ketosteroid isomerase-like protein